MCVLVSLFVCVCLFVCFQFNSINVFFACCISAGSVCFVCLCFSSARLDRDVFAVGLVEQLAAEQATAQLDQQQLLLLADLLQDALVLDGATRQIGQHLVHRAVRNVLVGRVAGLAWRVAGGGMDE